MNRPRPRALYLAAIAAILLSFGVIAQAQNQQQPAQPPAANAQQNAQTENKPAAPQAEKNPFAPVPAPPLPPGMTGSNVNDPRYSLKPGLYDAGETSMGLKHLD